MIITLMILFLIVYAVEGYTTVIAKQRGLREANPAMRWLYNKIGVIPGVLLFHIPVSVGTVYAVLIEQAGLTFILLLLIPFTLVMINNLYWLYRDKHG